MKQNIIFSLICLTLIFPLYSQEMDNDDIMPNEIYLQIEQIIYNSSEQYTFLYTNSTIRIYKKTISKIGFSKKKIVYYKKIKDVEKASMLIGEFTNLKGEKQSTETPAKIYFERVNSEKETVYYTLKPITNFTAWRILQGMVKLKIKALKTEKETEKEK